MVTQKTHPPFSKDEKYQNKDVATYNVDLNTVLAEINKLTGQSVNTIQGINSISEVEAIVWTDSNDDLNSLEFSDDLVIGNTQDGVVTFEVDLENSNSGTKTGKEDSDEKNDTGNDSLLDVNDSTDDSEDALDTISNNANNIADANGITFLVPDILTGGNDVSNEIVFFVLDQDDNDEQILVDETTDIPDTTGPDGVVTTELVTTTSEETTTQLSNANIKIANRMDDDDAEDINSNTATTEQTSTDTPPESPEDIPTSDTDQQNLNLSQNNITLNSPKSEIPTNNTETRMNSSNDSGSSSASLNIFNEILFFVSIVHVLSYV